MTRVDILENKVKLLEVDIAILRIHVENLIKFKKNTLCYLTQLHELNKGEK